MKRPAGFQNLKSKQKRGVFEMFLLKVFLKLFSFKLRNRSQTDEFLYNFFHMRAFFDHSGDMFETVKNRDPTRFSFETDSVFRNWMAQD